MAEFNITEEWVDRYVRDELDDEEREAFELALMNSPELSKALTSALGLLRAVELEDQYLPVEGAEAPLGGRQSASWQNMALAASLVLAVFSTTMYWRSSNEVSALQTDLDSLRQPVGSVLTVPVEIMRSGSELEAPRAFTIPDDIDLLLLDIEIPADHADESVLHMRLTTSSGDEIMAWQSKPLPSGNHNAVIRADTLPEGLLVLETRNKDGELINRRLLQLR